MKDSRKKLTSTEPHSILVREIRRPRLSIGEATEGEATEDEATEIPIPPQARPEETSPAPVIPIVPPRPEETKANPVKIICLVKGGPLFHLCDEKGERLATYEGDPRESFMPKLPSPEEAGPSQARVRYWCITFGPSSRTTAYSGGDIIEKLSSRGQKFA